GCADDQRIEVALGHQRAHAVELRVVAGPAHALNLQGHGRPDTVDDPAEPGAREGATRQDPLAVRGQHVLAGGYRSLGIPVEDGDQVGADELGGVDGDVS